MRLQACFESPNSLQAHVERLVRLRTGEMIRELRVEVLNDTIVLTGRTATYYTKQLATYAALDLLKDATLTNEIEVVHDCRIKPH
jgi:hypothetical protein